MTDKEYQILTRNLYLCAASALNSAKALSTFDEDDVKKGLETSIVKYNEYDPSTSKVDSLRILCYAERLIKELKLTIKQ